MNRPCNDKRSYERFLNVANAKVDIASAAFCQDCLHFKFQELEVCSFRLHHYFMSFICRLTARRLLSKWPTRRPKTRGASFLTLEELGKTLDDQIRSLFPRSSAAEVEAVVGARRGIWGGLNGGMCCDNLPTAYLTAKAKPK